MCMRFVFTKRCLTKVDDGESGMERSVESTLINKDTEKERERWKVDLVLSVFLNWAPCHFYARSKVLKKFELLYSFKRFPCSVLRTNYQNKFLKNNYETIANRSETIN